MRLVLALPQYHCGWSVEQDNMKDLLLSIIDLLNKIPATFWGVVVGSLFTLSGIYLTNRAGDRRLRLQFQSDRELKIGNAKWRSVKIPTQPLPRPSQCLSMSFPN